MSAQTVEQQADATNSSVMNVLQVAVDQSTVILANAVSDVKQQVTTYDEQYQVSATAAGYVNPAIDRAQSTLNDLRLQADKLRTQTVSATEVPVAVVTEQLNRAVNALTAIKTRALAFDDQHGGYAAKLSDRVKESRDMASANLADILAQVHKLQSDIQQQTTERVNTVKTTTVEGVQTYYDAVKVTVAQQAELVVNHPLPQSVKTYTEKLVSQTRERYNNAAQVVTELPQKVETRVTGFTQGVAQTAEAKTTQLITDAVAGIQQYESDHHYLAGIREWDASHYDLTSKTTQTASAVTGQVENRYQVVDKMSGLVQSATKLTTNLDEKYAISSTLTAVDDKVTGGVGTRAVSTGHSYVLSGLSTVVDFVRSSAKAAHVEEDAADAANVQD